MTPPSLTTLSRLREELLSARVRELRNSQDLIFCRQVLKVDFTYRSAQHCKAHLCTWILVLMNEYGQVAFWMPCAGQSTEVAAYAITILRRRHDINNVPPCDLIYTDNYCCSRQKWQGVWKIWNENAMVKLDGFHFMRRISMNLTTGRHNAWSEAFINDISDCIYSVDEDGLLRIPPPQEIDNSIREVITRYMDRTDSGIGILVKKAMQVYEARLLPHIINGCVSDPEDGRPMYIETVRPSKLKTVRSTGQVEALNRVFRTWVPSSNYGATTYDGIVINAVDLYNKRRFLEIPDYPELDQQPVRDPNDISGLEAMRRFENELLGEYNEEDERPELFATMAEVPYAAYSFVADGLRPFIPERPLILKARELFIDYHLNRTDIPQDEALRRFSLSQVWHFASAENKERRRELVQDLPEEEVLDALSSSSAESSDIEVIITDNEDNAGHIPQQYLVGIYPPRRRISRPHRIEGIPGASGPLRRRRIKLARIQTRTRQARYARWRAENKRIKSVVVPENVKAFIRQHENLYFHEEDFMDSWDFVRDENICHDCTFPTRRPFHVRYFASPGRRDNVYVCTMLCRRRVD